MSRTPFPVSENEGTVYIRPGTPLEQAEDSRLYIAMTQTVTLFAGEFVTLLALRAYRRTGSPALRALAVGLGLVTAGALLAYSLYAEGPSGDTDPGRADHSTYSE